MAIAERPNEPQDNEIPEQQLEGVSGGGVLHFNDKYEVIDEKTGDVLATFGSESEARKWAKEHDAGSLLISWKRVERLRGVY